ncbi:hypothetical protein [Azorhizophilus paspali]|uniref:Uncharacterized protein n=1 Tax=Azorhizophilus paspali TaxID=69963 RepID=A0ABV6SID7_AZOPA
MADIENLKRKRLLSPLRHEHDNDAERIESTARAVYEQWADQPGFVPWVPGGNSLKQDDARRIARAEIDTAMGKEAGGHSAENQAEARVNTGSELAGKGVKADG